MKNQNEIRENCFGWWLADIDTDIQPCSLTRRRTKTQNQTRAAQYLRSQQLVSPTTVPSREQLFDLVQSGRLRHLERHQNVLETLLGAKTTRLSESRPEPEVAQHSTSAPLSVFERVEYEEDTDVDKVLDDAMRNTHMDVDLAKQVGRLRELRAELSRLRSTTRALHRDLMGLDLTASRALSAVRTLRRDVNDLCFLDRILAAADGFLPLSSSGNLII